MYKIDEEELSILINLIEECAEVQKAVTKLIRFGYADAHPYTRKTNFRRLSEEIGNTMAVIGEMKDRKMISMLYVQSGADEKRKNMRKFGDID